MLRVHVDNRQKDLPVETKQLRALVRAVIAFEGQKCDEVGIHLVTAKEIAALHEHYFGDPAITDCVSFPISHQVGAYRLLGDVFVCPLVAIEYVQKKGGDPYEELSLYIVHGLLHLMGYDDMESKDRAEMRAAEKRHLKHLREKF